MIRFDRRRFLLGGGIVLGTACLGGTGLVACSDDDGGGAGDGGTGAGTGGPATSETTVPAGETSLDLSLLRTAASLEKLAVETYLAVAGSGAAIDAATVALAGLFQTHHQQHLDTLNGIIQGTGADPVTDANPALRVQLVDSVLSDPLVDQSRLVRLAHDLEAAVAQTYAFAATQLSTPTLRGALMAIGGVESGHAALLGSVLGEPASVLLPAAFASTDNPLPPNAFF